MPSGDPVASEETWINPTRAAFFFFFWDCTVADHLFDCGKLDGECSSSTDLKLITIFRYMKRSAIFFSNTCGAIVKKKRKKKEKKLSIARTKIDHERYRLLSAGHSEIGLFCISTFFLRIVVSSHDKGIGNFNEQWAKASHCFQTVRSRQLSRVVITRPYLATRKIQEKDEKKTRKEKKNERRRNQHARVRRYKITSTLGLLVRGDRQNEGLRGLQPRALGSKLLLLLLLLLPIFYGFRQQGELSLIEGVSRK